MKQFPSKSVFLRLAHQKGMSHEEIKQKYQELYEGILQQDGKNDHHNSGREHEKPGASPQSKTGG